jgi:hypothetical protein
VKYSSIALFIFFLFLPVFVFSQELVFPRDEGGKIHFKEVFRVDSMSKNTLYLNARQFMTSYWRSAKDVTQFDDKESGIIITSGWADVHFIVLGFPYKKKLYYTFKVSTKDGRYLAEIYNLFLQEYPDQVIMNPAKYPAEDLFTIDHYYKRNGKPKDLLLQIKYSIDGLVNSSYTSLNSAMTTVSSSNDDW